MNAELHALACHRDKDGNLVCKCRPIIVVAERRLKVAK